LRVGLVIYEDIQTLSGGYLYDRKLVEFLRGQGDTVEVISQPRRSYAGCLADGLGAKWLDRMAGLEVDVLLQDELNHPSLVGLNPRLRRAAHFPIISIVHHLRSSEKLPAALAPVYRGVEQAYLQSVDGFIFNSRTTRAAVEALTGEMPGIHVVATPAGDRFGGGLAESEILQRLRRGGALRALFIGNLIERKGVDTLLRALAKAPAEGVQLRVAGRMDVDHAYTQNLLRLDERLGLAQRVQFLGALSDSELVEELRCADVLVVPSQYEGFGIVYLEGMSFGLPALASTAGGAGEIIQDGVNGLLCAAGDVHGLAERLGRLATDRKRLGEMSLAARRRFAEFPGWEESMRKARNFLVEISGVH
jgi:glycosyltransferase involved in cell wall biosynthesis